MGSVSPCLFCGFLVDGFVGLIVCDMGIRIVNIEDLMDFDTVLECLGLV